MYSEPVAMLSIFLALFAGVLQPLQAAINSRLGKETGNPMFSAFASGIISGLVIGLYLLCSRHLLPRGWSAALQLPWWVWSGGFLGAAYLTAVIIATPKLGTGTLMALVIAVQVAVSVALDHFAAFGLDRHPASWPRIAGVLCFVVGAFLVQRF